MVVDIHGCIEVRSKGGWSAVVRLDDLYTGCDYVAFGYLFGVRNDAGFTPIAAGRGIPDDVARLTRKELEDWGDDVHWPSWISYDEVVAIEGDKRSQSIDERVFNGSDWDVVWSAMADRSRLVGPANCRLVVWFDR